MKISSDVSINDREERQIPAVPHHIGIIPDGNRRFARKRRISFEESYLLGAEQGLRVVEWCLAKGIRHLSAFGLSTDNIERRPIEEIHTLHKAVLYFCRAVHLCAKVRLNLFGDVVNWPWSVPEQRQLRILQAASDRATQASLVVHVGLNLSAPAELATLLSAVRVHGLDAVASAPDKYTLSSAVPPVDLVIRTGGQQRLSGFLPLQTAYAELWFTSTLWSEFCVEEFEQAIAWYMKQERRFGE